MSAPTGITVVRSYWIEDASGNVLAKTIGEKTNGNFLNSIPYLTYSIVDEKETIAKVESRTSMVNVNFLHLKVPSLHLLEKASACYFSISSLCYKKG